MNQFLSIMVILIATQISYGAGNSPGAYNKLEKMYQSAKAPISLAQLIKDISLIKSCAGANSDSPDYMTHVKKLNVVSFSTNPNFGPEFPPEIIKYIILNESNEAAAINWILEKYSSNLTSQQLELNTIKYSIDRECDTDSTGETSCYDTTDIDVIQLQIRQTPQFIIFTHENSYNYCWK